MKLNLVPRTGAFYDLFAEAGDNALEAARKAETRFREYPNSSVTQADVKAVEHEGDRITRDLIQLLNTQHVTPFDREDIFALATTLDDVVDHIDEATDLLDLYRIESAAAPAIEQCRILVGAVEHLADALRGLRGRSGAQESLVALKQLEDEGDRVVHDAIAAPFPGRTNRPARGHTLEGRVRRARGGDRRLRDSWERDREHPRQERLKGSVDLDFLLIAVVMMALFFDFTNGFHDAANAIATAVSTRALSPRLAVLMSAALNFAGAFVSLEVAATVAKDVVVPDAISLDVVLAGLVGAITWNLITWYLGLPSSSSHARSCRSVHSRCSRFADHRELRISNVTLRPPSRASKAGGSMTEVSSRPAVVWTLQARQRSAHGVPSASHSSP